MNYRKKHITPKIRRFKKRKKFFQKPVFWIFLLLILVIIFLYVILFWPKFQVSKIEVMGNEKIQGKDIKHVAFDAASRKIFNISSKSIFMVDVKSLEKSILDKFPDIQSVTIKKMYPNDITLQVTERTPFMVFCQNTTDCFFIDINGVAFEKVKEVPQGMAVIIKDFDGKEVYLGKTVIEKGAMDMISVIASNLKDNFQIGVKEVLVGNSLIFTTSENWKVYFDLALDVRPQVTKMNVLLKDQITAKDRKKLQYIYLQYKDRAYFK